MATLEFQHPTKEGKMTDGWMEKKSKALDPNSKLFALLTTVRKTLMVYCQEHKIVLENERPLHTELISRKESHAMTSLQERAAKFHNIKIDLNKENWYWCGRAFALQIPCGHITMICLQDKNLCQDKLLDIFTQLACLACKTRE